MTIEGEPSVARREESSEDDDVEDETYVLSPRAHGRGKGLASCSGSGATRDDEEIEEEAEGDEEEEVFDVEEILPPSYVNIGPLVFRVPSNPTWRVKVSYKGKIESAREIGRSMPAYYIETPMITSSTHSFSRTSMSQSSLVRVNQW
jgi:hypothetical protein